MIDNVDISIGKAMYHQLEIEDPKILMNHSLFDNDLVGNPWVYPFPNIGNVSPTTLRFVEILSLLNRHYKDLSHFNILEIGGGYGGQCRIIKSYYPDVKYTIIDHPDVICVAKRFLKSLGINDVEFISFFDVEPNNIYRNSDLVISNYSFSELYKDYVELYFERFLSRTKHCYMRMNNLKVKKPFCKNLMMKDEIIKFFEDKNLPIHVINDLKRNSFHPDCFTIYW